MSKAKPTAGPWTLGDENNACCEVLLGTEHNLTCNFDRRDNNTCAEVISREEMLANAFLVIEAGTVFHSTGLSPAQLVEMVGALKVALQYAEEYISGHTPTNSWGLLDRRQDADRCETLEKVRAALAKCEGVK